MDRKPVFILSTNCQPENPNLKTKRNLKSGLTEIPIPPAIHQYNNFKSGVDLADQLRSYNAIALKQLKRWWLPLFFF